MGPPTKGRRNRHAAISANAPRLASNVRPAAGGAAFSIAPANETSSMAAAAVSAWRMTASIAAGMIRAIGAQDQPLEAHQMSLRISVREVGRGPRNSQTHAELS